MKVYGLIGDPVEHSISPEMQNSAFRELEIDAVYCKFRVLESDLEDAVKGVRALGICGLNVTIPHKESIIQYLDSVDENALRIGAVNTVKLEKNRLIGYNTDGRGAVTPLKEFGGVKGKTALILGAGGAARSVCFELFEEGARHIHIANRTRERADKLCNDLREYGCSCSVSGLTEGEIKEAIQDVAFVINCSSVGMYPESNISLLREGLLHPDLVVEDVVYNPLKTKLLSEAEKAGAKTVGGIEMLVLQGALSFEIWTGEKAPVQVMKNSALKALTEFINTRIK